MSGFIDPVLETANSVYSENQQTHQKYSTSSYISSPSNIVESNYNTFVNVNNRKRGYRTYEILENLGNGTYGEVYRALCVETKSIVCIKRMVNAFDNTNHAKSSLREILILTNIHHPNIISFYEILQPLNYDLFTDVYFVMETMEMDLHWIIYTQKLSLNHIRYICYQILCALHCLHSNNIIHRDLKPSNILVNSDSTTKLCDFGLSCEESENMSEYVVSRWYRSPELLLESSYSSPIDIWAFGLIAYEMFTGSALLRCNDTLQQLTSIFQVFGIPNNLDFVTNPSALKFCEQYRQNCQPTGFLKCFKEQPDPEFYDLLVCCLQVDPNCRYTAGALLQHPFFKSYFNPNDLIVTDSLQTSLSEIRKLDAESMKQIAFNIMQKYH